jgi:CBS domain containing-hemolysin-like protein
MFLLLVCSAFFSGSETAFFNISHGQLEIFGKSGHKLQELAVRLLRRPKRLLTSLLLGNMTVNVCFFSLASVLSVRLGSQAGAAAGSAAAVVCFFVLLIMGEMLPKSIAYSNTKKFCVFAAPGSLICTRVLSVLVRGLEFAVFEPAFRLLIGPVRATKAAETVTMTQMKILIEQSRQQGLISNDENQILSEVCEFGLLKVRHVMTPRVDMSACSITEPVKKVRQQMISSGITKLPVYAKSIDNIVGLVSLRDLLLKPRTRLDKLVQKAYFLPEQKTVESLLEFFHLEHTDTAVVVDEYGGITGMVSFDHVIEELLGPTEQISQDDLIEQIGPMQYRLAGALSVHDWGQIFEIDPVQSRLTTVGGLAVALLGRIPKAGDTVYLKNLKLTVEKVKRHRIETLLLTLEPIGGQNSNQE